VPKDYPVALLFARHSQSGLPAGLPGGFLDVTGRLVDRAVHHGETGGQLGAGPHHQGLVVVALAATQVMVDVDAVKPGRPAGSYRSGRQQVEQGQRILASGDHEQSTRLGREKLLARDQLPDATGERGPSSSMPLGSQAHSCTPSSSRPPGLILYYHNPASLEQGGHP